ncbi:class I SAM-dependent methyltransferase [Halovivax sp.]|uniref:class I SAM-dependent methyltransferase n=1 Tax=Halovivax sp. TaxID=1935978 RepID=UPI0025C582B0|nr:class I SAM-dependent methyltransferase [Halovivax sp.]
MTEDEKRRWEARAERDGFDPSAGPADLVRESAADLPSGRALDVATGEGRNAIFLAERGFTVDAVDISRTMLDRARGRAAERSASVNWILADVDDYCFSAAAYDVVTISYFDARDRLDAVKRALAPGGVLCYEHHLTTDSDDVADPSARYRFEPGELREACSDLTIDRYEEDRDAKLVRMVARNE